MTKALAQVSCVSVASLFAVCCVRLCLVVIARSLLGQRMSPVERMNGDRLQIGALQDLLEWMKSGGR